MAVPPSPLVAREKELAALRSCAATAPAVAIIQGEAGVGKTRLVAEAVSDLQVGGRRVLVGRCHPLLEPFPLGPVVEALRGLAGISPGLCLSPLAGVLRSVLPELGPVLPPTPDPLPDAGMERHRLWRAVVELIEATGPAVLVLEDLHWADMATAEFIAFLARQLSGDSVIMLTWRPEDLAPVSPLRSLAGHLAPTTTTAVVALVPLDPGEVRELVRGILGSDEVSEEFAAYLHDRTAGIPFAVEEFIYLLQDRQDLVRWEGGWARRALDELEVPAAIRDSILERIERLGPDTRRIAEAAAILGVAAPESLLAAVGVLPDPRANTALVAAVGSGILEDEGQGEYGFRHALAAEAVYSAIPPPARRRLHRQAAAALASYSSGRPSLAQLAHHSKEGAQTEPWVRYAVLAAEQAGSLGDHGAAAAFLLDALSAPGTGPRIRAHLALDLSTAALHGLAHREAIAAVTGVLGNADLPSELRCLLRFNLGALLHQAGDASGARQEIARALPDLRRESASGAVTAMLALASPWVLEGDLKEHVGWLERAGTAAATLRGDPGHEIDTETEVRQAADRAAVLVAVGDPAGWDAVPGAPGPTASLERQYEWVRACSNIAINSFYLGHYTRSREWLAQATAASKYLDYARLNSAIQATELLLAWAQGDWGGLAGRAEHLATVALDAPSSVQANTVLGLLDLANGRPDEAEIRLRSALEAAKTCGAVPTMGMAAAGLARLRLSRDQPDEALSLALPVLEIVARKRIWAWSADVAPVVVEALMTCGKSEDAGEWVRRLAKGLEDRDTPGAHAALVHCRALLSGIDGDQSRSGADVLLRAHDAWAALPNPYQAAIAGELRANSALRRESDRETDRETDDGGALLLDALAAFHRLGAVWDEARVRHSLRRERVALPYPWRGGHRSRDNELSPREHEIVELASTGLTSASIAKRLFLSPRTVDHHVARALKKLGLTSRKSLIEAREKGGDREIG